MKIQLINQPNPLFSPQKQILINRGFDEKEIEHYFNLTDIDINDPEIFGEELLAAAATALRNTIDADEDICIVVDCDCDGYTSSAILINYLHDLAPAFTENHVHWFMHEGKQHGLSDAMDWIESINPSLVIIPDAGSNDADQLYELEDIGTNIIILDHHEIEERDFWLTERHPHAFLINSQFPQYPNKELSGAGVVWQFCRYLDKLWNNSYANQYLDLTALGLIGDMMSLKSFETRRIITKGIEPDRITNPFIYEMWQKNKFKLTDTPTAWGETFYIVPFVNAITRSGTLEEKELIFSSMLKFKAFNEILSNKRGHKLGEKERVVDQAIRTCTNVKNRQGREEEKGIELVTHLIEENHMMDHKVLLFLLEPGAIKAEIRGLVANKLMAKYQRPCCMLTKVVDEDGRESYQGSARGCDKVGVTEFKDICAATQVCDYTIGHQGAFGLSITTKIPGEEEIAGDRIYQFLDKTDEILKDMPNEPLYYVDYAWQPTDDFGEEILDIAQFDPYIGKDLDEPLVAVIGVDITKDNITLMKSNTVKITLPNGVNMIKFNMPEEEYNKLYSESGAVQVDVVGTANCNTWNGNDYPQIMIKDINIKRKVAYIF
jgi:single-stranded-DNA-specific exonuclease